MKIRNIIITAAAAGLIAAAVPAYVAVCSAAAGEKSAEIPAGSTVILHDGSTIASVSRFINNTDGSAAQYLAEEKSSYSTHFSCFFGKGGSVSEKLAYIIDPDCSAIDCIAISNYLEKSCSYNELAGFLCSAAEFANGIYGIENAAAYYFAAKPEALTQEQLRALGTIYKSDKYRGMTPARLADEECFSGLDFNPDYRCTTLYGSDYLTGVISELRAGLTEQGMTREQADELIFCKGLEITVPMDAAVQSALDTTIRGGTDTGSFQIGAQVMDYEGRVLGCVGSIGDCSVNHTQKTLSPGSAIKPLSVYAPAIEAGIITYSELLPDYPFDYQSEWPQNYNRLFEQQVTAVHALRQSKNTTAVFLADRLGTENCLSLLKECGFGHIGAQDAALMGMGLGYMDTGVTLCELNVAYAAFGNGGKYYAPTFVTSASRENEVVYAPDLQPKQVFSEQTAWIMNRMMKSNVDMRDGLGFGAQLEGVEVFGKSGTTDRDGVVDNTWFIAGCPDYVTAVWIGLDYQRENTGMPSGAKLCNILMGKTEHKTADFTPCSGVVQREFCTETGKLSGKGCADTEIGWYTGGNIPELCSGTH